jgi:hypothetical protein
MPDASDLTTGLPIRQMLLDADAAWTIFEDDMRTRHTMLLGDMACHVRALAAEVERLETRMSRDTWYTPCETCKVKLDPFPDSGTGKPRMMVCFGCEPPTTLCATCMTLHRECRTAPAPARGRIP